MEMHPIQDLWLIKLDGELSLPSGNLGLLVAALVLCVKCSCCRPYNFIGKNIPTSCKLKLSSYK